MTNADSVISIADLRKRYRAGLFGKGVEALRGASLEVPKGEIFGLLGPNGAGKTTMVKILLGIIRKSSGRAQLLGYSAGDKRGRRRVGYLPEHLKVAAHHTAQSALEFYGGLSGMSRSAIRKRAGQLIDVVGLKNRDRESVKRFSKGMMQRLGLAQALLHEPDVVFLDEPTDGLDPVGRSQVRSLLQDLRDQGRTIFLNSHLLQEVELVCDRVAILDKGELKYVGSIQDLTPESEVETQVSCAATPDNVASALSALDRIDIRKVDEETLVQMSGNSQRDLDGVVDALRAAGISISSIQQRRLTLEDAFLQLVNLPRGPQ